MDLEDVDFPLTAALSPAGPVLPKPNAGASLPIPAFPHKRGTDRFAFPALFRLGVSEAAAVKLVISAGFAVSYFHCSLSLGNKRTFHEERLLHPRSGAAGTPLKGVIETPPASHGVCAMPGAALWAQK